MTTKTARSTVPFFVLGVAFVAIGVAGNRVFIAIGLAFMAIYFAQVARARRR
jgi:hypothetical protein